jgi:hypothetical protein
MLDAQEAASGKKRGVAQRDGDTKQGRFSARTVLVLNSDDPPCLVLLNLVHLSFALSLSLCVSLYCIMSSPMSDRCT